MEWFQKRTGGFLFYLFSAWCIVSCIWLYRIERSAADPKEPEMEIPSQAFSDVQDAAEAYADALEDILAKTEESLREKQADISRLREKYAVLAMLEEKENQAAREICPDRMYEKYFRLKEGELARIEGDEDAEQVGCMGNLNSHFTSFAFEIHMDMWVQYSDKGYIVEYDTPGAIVIENPDVDMGYMDARAGMNFEEIQERAGVREVQTGFMYTSSYEIYYLEYEADGYVYRYLSDQPDGTDSWLEINHSSKRAENGAVQIGATDYSDYLKRVYIVDGWNAGNYPVSLVITQIGEGSVEGQLQFGHRLTYLPGNREPQFQGVLYDKMAECEYEVDGRKGNIFLTFAEDARIKAEWEDDKVRRYLLRPYSLSDVDLSDTSCTEISLDAWGTVLLISGTFDAAHHPYPCFYLTNERDDILYGDSCGINGMDVWDIFVEDMNGDGLQDMLAVTDGDGDRPSGYLYVRTLYQEPDGSFSKDRNTKWKELPEIYYGDYRIVEFCPTEDYSEHAEEWLTRQEADSMLGRIIEIKDDGMVTYDSQRRRGTRTDRHLVQGVFEFQHDYPYYSWTEIPAEGTQRDFLVDDDMKAAVGEEYYEKIDGVFECIHYEVQQFYTLAEEDKLIMHSLLSKQYFILEKE